MKRQNMDFLAANGMKKNLRTDAWKMSQQFCATRKAIDKLTVCELENGDLY